MLTPRKAKNDEKSKRRPHQAASLLLMLVIAAATAVAALLSQRPADNGLPTTALTYTGFLADSFGRIRLDWQMGKRTIIPDTPSNPTLEKSGFEFVNSLAVPKVSPDGRWLVGWQLSPEHNDLWLVRKDRQTLESQDLRLILGCGSPLNWSVDSQWVAYSGPPPDTTLDNWWPQQEELFIINVVTGETIRLTTNNYYDADPAFSPDGTQIVYTSAADGDNRLYIMDIASRESRLLTSATTGSKGVWSPDGRWIVYLTTPQINDYDMDIWIIRPDGTGGAGCRNGT